MNERTLTPIFAALSDERRLRALAFIARRDPSCCPADEGVCACDVQEHLELSQPATSYHMKALREAGLVRAEKRGRWVHYRVSPDGLAALRSFVEALDDAVPALSRAAS